MPTMAVDSSDWLEMTSGRFVIDVVLAQLALDYPAFDAIVRHREQFLDGHLASGGGHCGRPPACSFR